MTKWAGRIAFGIAAIALVVSVAMLLNAFWFWAVEHKRTGEFWQSLMVLFGLNSVALMILTLLLRRCVNFLIKMPPPQVMDSIFETVMHRVTALRSDPSRQTDAEVELHMSDVLEQAAMLIKDVRESWAGRQPEKVAAAANHKS